MAEIPHSVIRFIIQYFSFSVTPLRQQVAVYENKYMIIHVVPTRPKTKNVKDVESQHFQSLLQHDFLSNYWYK